MNSEFVKQKQLTTKPLSRLIPVYNVDRSLNEVGSISEIVEVVLRYQDHSERATFAVTSLGKQDVILGLTWLHEHNPEINWETAEVKMSRCPNHCRICQHEVNEERKVQFAEGESIRACRAGLTPFPNIEMDNIPDFETDLDDEEDEQDTEEKPYEGDDQLEEGDRLFATMTPVKLNSFRPRQMFRND
jgi:hypothetical protein